MQEIKEWSTFSLKDSSKYLVLLIISKRVKCTRFEENSISFALFHETFIDCPYKDIQHRQG